MLRLPQPFIVKVGTVFESSHIPMRLWLQAIFLIASSKKGISTNQLQRTLGVTIKAEAHPDNRPGAIGSFFGDREEPGSG